MLATTIFGVGRAGPAGGRARCSRWYTSLGKQLDGRTVARQVLLSSTAMSVGQGAQRGFQLGVDRAALAQDPGQAKQG